MTPRQGGTKPQEGSQRQVRAMTLSATQQADHRCGGLERAINICGLEKLEARIWQCLKKSGNTEQTGSCNGHTADFLLVPNIPYYE